MKVTEEGTTNIIKWYQPECGADCESIDCRRCVYNQYAAMDARCPFKQYLIDHPVEKPTGTGALRMVLKGNAMPFYLPDKLRSAEQWLEEAKEEKAKEQVTCSTQDIFDMYMSLQANTVRAQVGPLQDMVNVLDLIIEITEKQDELTAIRPKHKEEDQIYTENEHVKNEGHADLSICSKMENAADDEFGWDFYHRCPQSQNSFVRLVYDEDRVEHTCPICKRVFLQHTAIPHKSPTLK